MDETRSHKPPTLIVSILDETRTETGVCMLRRETLFPLSLAIQLREEIRHFENERLIAERILRDINAIQCTMPGQEP
jgi:hypothetical protein